MVFLKEIKLSKEEIKEENISNSRYNSVIGSSLVIAGLPIIKKRFVTPGASRGTSIASKYLSQKLPLLYGSTQILPRRFLGTTIVGRALGRMVPYVGWTLIAIDIVDIIIEITENNNDNSILAFTGGFTGGFGGGSFSGRGSSYNF